MEGFTFTSALDSNMGYYHIKLDADAQKLYTIVFPCQIEKYKCKRLSCQSLFKIWNMLRQRYYLGDWLILTNRNNSFKDHQLRLEMVLERFSTSGMRVNISKSKFFAEQIEYLGY
jgi:hypothetical protein